jgi:hypothetical protein
VKEEIETAFANHANMMARCGVLTLLRQLLQLVLITISLTVLSLITYRSVTGTVPSTSKKLQLQFMARLSLPIFTGTKIEGEGSFSMTIALVDEFTGQIVASGKESLMKVEIVVLEGDFEGEDWTSQEFDNNIVREREGKRPLISGDVFVALTGGIGTAREVSLTDNSSWTRSRKFRLGARTEDGCFNGIRVREAKTESFVVKDHRGERESMHWFYITYSFTLLRGFVASTFLPGKTQSGRTLHKWELRAPCCPLFISSAFLRGMTICLSTWYDKLCHTKSSPLIL